MKKFILIDHSIVGLAGHHYEYAVRVLKAAQEAGYTPILATNRRFRKKVKTPWKVYPVYNYGFWFSVAPPMGYRSIVRLFRVFGKWTTRLKYKVIFSPLGFLWSLHRYPGAYRQYARYLTSSLTTFKLFLTAFIMMPAFYLAILARAIWRVFVAAVPAHGYIKNLWNRFKEMLHAIFPIVKLYRRREIIQRLLFDSRRLQKFGSDTNSLFHKVRLNEGDIVLIPTLSEIEMQGLQRFFQKNRRSSKASWHLVFRRNIYTGREPDYDEQTEVNRLLEVSFNHFNDNLGNNKVYFYTDTEKLTAQYNRLNATPFQTLPIPVSETLKSMSGRKQVKAPLRIIYLGDARKEKGYHLLPQVVQDLWADYVETGKIIFIFQSNFNIPDGEPEAAVARAQLEGYPKDKVQLVTEPLTTEGYNQLLLSGDICLLPYERDNYYARSSGIMVESLVAGIPVIVPAATWMSEQFIEKTYNYHASLNNKSKNIKHLDGAALTWCNTGNIELHPMSAEQLTFRGEEAKSFCWLSPPKKASFLLISFNVATKQSGLFVQVSIDQFSRDGYSLRQSKTLVNRVNSYYPSSILVPVEANTKRIWVGLNNAFALSPVTVSDIKINFLSSEKPQRYPLGTIGLAYTNPDEISDLIREMVDNYAHYSKTARDFAQGWFEKHNARRLVEELKQASDR